MTAPYPVPAAPVECEETIKKSRFITCLAHTPGVDAARDFIASVRRAHPGARHHCWAHVAGSPADSLQYGFSDDGEPSGTAGKPILGQLSGSGIGEICAVVVRYSGGIRLGTGGLVHAYGGGVAQALAQLTTRLKIERTALAIACSYTDLPKVERLVEQFDGEVTQVDYGAEIQLRVAVDSRQAEALVVRIFEATRGLVQPRVVQ